jgi:hypothetical protein
MLRDEDTINVRSSVTMRQVAEAYGYQISRTGFIHCPFHPHDKHPSMKIYDGNRGYHCFVCHAGGDVIDFVKRHDGLEFEAAVRHLAELFGIAISDGKSKLSRNEKRKIAEQKTKREASEKVRKAGQERLNALGAEIYELDRYQRLFPSLSDVWSQVQRILENRQNEWEELSGLLNKEGRDTTPLIEKMLQEGRCKQGLVSKEQLKSYGSIYGFIRNLYRKYYPLRRANFLYIDEMRYVMREWAESSAKEDALFPKDFYGEFCTAIGHWFEDKFYGVADISNMLQEIWAFQKASMQLDLSKDDAWDQVIDTGTSMADRYAKEELCNAARPIIVAVLREIDRIDGHGSKERGARHEETAAGVP